MHRNYKFRLFTNANQQRELSIMLESHRRLYNAALDGKMLCWETARVKWSYVEQCRWFVRQRQQNAHYARLNVSSGYLTLRRLDKAFDRFYSRVKAGQLPGHPRFKGKDRFDSFAFTFRTPRCGDGCSVVNRKLRIQHVGMIRVCWHREMPDGAQIKQVTITREGGKWFVIFSCELPDTPIPKSTKPAVGIDVGLESFLTTSDGQHEPNPRFHKESLPALRVAQRAVSRKKRGGSNRRKAVRVVQVCHARVRNQRREHHYQVANRLVRAYGLIAVERLNTQGMLRNGRLSRAISDAGWYSFTCILKHVAEKAGAQVVDVDPCGTSQECSGCGKEVRKALSERRHRCECGLDVHRDVNAARNILARGLARTAPAGVNVGQQVKRSPRSRQLVFRLMK